MSIEKLPPYTVIVPSIDGTGPVNVAMDIARECASNGWAVTILYLSKRDISIDVGFAKCVRRFNVLDFFLLKGLVHTHCLRPDIIGFVLSFFHRCKLVSTMHNLFLLDFGFMHGQPISTIAWKILRVALSRYDRVVCISESMRRYYSRVLTKNTKLSVAYNFRSLIIRHEEVASETLVWFESQRLKDRTVLAFVGSLSKRKNISSLLGRIGDAKNISLIICGQGPQYSEMRALVDSLDMADRVRFVGHIENPCSIIKKSDCLVLPSFSEGFPLVAIEAASVGIPCLLSDIAIHRELESFGFGSTFDHRCYRNFDERLSELLMRFQNMEESHRLVQIWRDNFSPVAGFSRYENIFLSLNEVAG